MTRQTSSSATAGTGGADRLWTVEDASAFLGVPVGTLYQWRTRRQGPRAFRVGRHLRYDPAEIRQWLEGQAS